MQLKSGLATVALLILAVGLYLFSPRAAAQMGTDALWTPEIPAPLVGPYITDPATLMQLDRVGNACGIDAGPLNFRCLIFRDDRAFMTSADLSQNPFTIPVFAEVLETVREDLRSIRLHSEYGGAQAQSLREGFLTFAGAKIELVGVINRMDRQFNRDIVPGHGKPMPCGEISAIYRFGYEGELASTATGDRHYRSRLPVTMNVVFPAVPWSGELSCAEAAGRWLDYTEALTSHASPEVLLEKARVLVSSLRPEDIDRIELNMQGSRVTASDDSVEDRENVAPTDFGTLATYLIRVFRWAPGAADQGRWRPSYLTNQIDRARLLGSEGDENTCAEHRGERLSRRELADFVLSMNASGTGPNGIGDVDTGLINIPQKFLACRAVSISPGGASRSGNQPFWKATAASEQILTDAEIEAALARYRRRYPDSLGFVGSADEFRTRLNDSSCSGCHQTRGIAGFHFPGADRPGASPVNAVFLPGSPHFFGDQLRRLEILREIAHDGRAGQRTLAMSYAARPQNRFAALRPTQDPTVPTARNIQLVGGWGGACLTRRVPAGVRQWNCAANLECQPLFGSVNQPGVGVCTNPAGRPQVGEAMQQGTVASSRFGWDLYTRVAPAIGAGTPRDTRISTDHLVAPAGNSFLAAHQEFYIGTGNLDPLPGENAEQQARRVRDQSTGGFPAGALRLSECVGLPNDATCGLLAASGFNDCLTEVGEGKRTPDNCFLIYTNYSGVRACEAANPCRDDYICMSPMGYTSANAADRFKARAAARQSARNSPAESSLNRQRLGINFFGEKMPDAGWLSRNDGRGDKRGVCIPPYFVFQFKADGHRVPASW